MGDHIDLDFSSLYGPRGIIAFNKVPRALRVLRRWVMWKDKIPMTVHGAYAKVNDESTWTTFDEVTRAYRVGGSFDGIGFVFVEGDGFVGIDLDHCIERSVIEGGHDVGEVRETLSDFARLAVEQIDSYTEISPSGLGLHIIARLKTSGVGSNGATVTLGDRRRSSGVEVYTSARYFTITGDQWLGTPGEVEDRGSEVLALYHHIFDADTDIVGYRGVGGDAVVAGVANNRGGTFRVITPRRAKLLFRGSWMGGYESQSDADLALCRYMAHRYMREGYDDSAVATRVDRMMRKSGLMRHKWDAGRGAMTYGQRTVARAVRDARGIVGPLVADGGDDDGVGDDNVVVFPIHDLHEGMNGRGGIESGAENGVGDEIDRVGEGVGWVDVEDDGDVEDDAGALTGGVAVLTLVEDRDRTGEGDAGGKGGDGAPFDGFGIDPVMCANTDDGNALRLIARFGDRIRYLTGTSRGEGWLIWNGVRWQPDGSERIVDLARRVVRLIGSEAAVLPNQADRDERLKWALASQHAARVAGMISLARSDPRIEVTRDDIDQNLWLLNTPGGTIDLGGDGRGKAAGEITVRENRQEDFITRVTAVSWIKGSEWRDWQYYVDAWEDGRDGWGKYMQRAWGYCLSGVSSEKIIFLAHGKPDTAKTTMLESLKNMLGSYGTSLTGDALLKGRGVGTARPDIAKLVGMRAALTSEPRRGGKLDEEVVKRLTGGDTMTARHLYEKEFNFYPQVKVWMLANTAPEVPFGEEGLWERIWLIPFVRRFKRNDDVQYRLLHDSGLHQQKLAWCIEGLRDWKEQGLNPPPCVMAATAGYKSDNDPTRAFIEECCIEGDVPHGEWGDGGLNMKNYVKVTRRGIWEAYRAFGKASGFSDRELLKMPALNKVLEDKYRLVRWVNQWWFVGLGLKQDEELELS